MKQAGSMSAAKAMIEAAGFRFDALRSFEPDGSQPGWAFSVETVRGLFGHPKAEVQIVPANSSFAAERRRAIQNAAKCAICGAAVQSRGQWLSELCPKQLSGKSMHALPAENIGRLRA